MMTDDDPPKILTHLTVKDKLCLFKYGNDSYNK